MNLSKKILASFKRTERELRYIMLINQSKSGSVLDFAIENRKIKNAISSLNKDNSMGWFAL